MERGTHPVRTGQDSGGEQLTTSRVPSSLPPPTGIATWGDTRSTAIDIPYRKLIQTFYNQAPGGLRSGPETDRTIQEGQMKAELVTFAGGLLTSPRIHEWRSNLDKLAFSQGLVHHVPGVLCHCYALTTQATLQAVDYSTARALNYRGHCLSSTLGVTSNRFLVGIGHYLFTDTSSSDSALVLEHTLTNVIRSMAPLRVGNVDCIGIGTSGPTDDVFMFTDLDNISGSDTPLFALASGDIIDKMASFPTLGGGFNIYGGIINGINGIWETRHSEAAGTTPRQVLLADLANTPNISNTSVTTSAKSPTVSYVDYSDTGDIASVTWLTPENIFSSNDARATINVGSTTGRTPRLVAGGFGLNIPTGSTIKGISVAIEASEAALGDNFHLGHVNDAESGITLVFGGTRHAASRKQDSTELTATDSVRTFGSSTDPWTHVDAADLADLGVEIIGYTLAGGANSTLRIDHLTVTVTYVPPGVAAGGGSAAGGDGGGAIPAGGFTPGPLPTNPHRLPVVAPVREEQDSVLLPRQLWFEDFTYSPDGDVPLVTISKPHTGLNHIEWAANGLGGIVVGGDNSSGIATSVKLVRSDGEVIDLRQPTTYNGKAIGSVAGTVQGRFVQVQMVYEDFTDAQVWGYFDGRWFVLGLLQDLSSAISACPFGWSNWDVSQGNRRLYTLYPVSTTHLAASRQFVPRDLLSDPLTTNVSETKYEGPLIAQTAELNLFGPIEAQKTLNVVQYQGRQISPTASGGYGSLLVRVNIAGDINFSVSAVNTGTQTTAFWIYNVPNAGIALQTAILRFIGDNTGQATKTGNYLPLLVTGTSTWPEIIAWTFYLDPRVLEGQEDWATKVKRVLTAKATKATQSLRVANWDRVPATPMAPRVAMSAVDQSGIATLIDGTGADAPTWTFIQIPGVAATT